MSFGIFLAESPSSYDGADTIRLFFSLFCDKKSRKHLEVSEKVRIFASLLRNKAS